MSAYLGIPRCDSVNIENALAIICCTLLALAGCTTRGYEGPELPQEEVAVLIAEYFYGPDLAIRARYLDGTRIGTTILNVHMKPGIHEVEIIHLPRHGLTWTWRECATLHWYAEAGVTYRLGDVDDDTVSIVIDGSGEEVARAELEECSDRGWLG